MSIHPTIKLFLICLSGFLLSLSMPGYGLWFLAWILISPYFIVINTAKSVKEAVLYSFIFGFSYNFWCLHWLFSIHPLNWLGFSNFQSLVISSLALLFTATYQSFFFILFSICAVYFKRLSFSPYNKGILNFLLITFLWLVIFNKLSGAKVVFGFPWTLIEYSQYKNLYLIQICEYFGSTAISFLIVFFNLVLADFLVWLFNIEKISNRYVPKDPAYFGGLVSGFFFVLVLIVLSIVSGSFLISKNQENFSNKSQSIAVLQGNLPIKATRGACLDIKLARKTYNNLISNLEVPLIITPEGALPTVFTSDATTQYWVKDLSRKKETDFISGSYCKSGDKLTNCAVIFSRANNNFLYYEKERLVPFGEFTPFSFLLPGPLKKLASNIIGEGFTEGKENKPLDSKLGKIGVNICFELIFPAIIRNHLLNGANLLVNLSDLSWFSNDLAKQQFLSFAVFRAIENRKPIVIATNNGISAFVEASGKIKSQTLPNNQGVLLDWVNLNNKITFYAKYGW